MRYRRQTTLRTTPPAARPAGTADLASRVRGFFRNTPALICVGLVVAVLVVYAQAAGFVFVAYDDNEYVTENDRVTGGLTAGNVAWAFTAYHAANWHPLTWLSHMLDSDLYGRWPGGHHLTSVLLFAATGPVLFLTLRRLTRDTWPAALAAALFALHPLRAESVAWVSERKDVLSGLFFVLTLAAYAGYARRLSAGRYVLVVALFVLGLLAKPMLVTVPCVLLLLDFWPLRRVGWGGAAPDADPAAGVPASVWRLVAEKLPLFVLSAVSCVVTVQAQAPSVRPLERIPLGMRVANAADAYLMYLVQTAYPAELAVLYPHPEGNLPVWRAAVGAVLLVAVSVAVVLFRRRFPYLAVGWFWYLGMLVPVIGLVQVGAQSRADRYTYLPHIGLWIALAWGVADMVRAAVLPRRAAVAAAGLVLVVLAQLSWRQAGYWQDSYTLFYHAIDCTTDNETAHYNIGTLMMYERRYDEGMAHFRRAIEINDSPKAHNNAGYSLVILKRYGEAIDHFRRALEREPNFLLAKRNMALAYILQSVPLKAEQKNEETIELYETAHALVPEDPTVRRKLSTMYADLGANRLREGRTAEALGLYRKAVKTDPENADAASALAAAERDAKK